MILKFKPRMSRSDRDALPFACPPKPQAKAGLHNDEFKPKGTFKKIDLYF